MENVFAPEEGAIAKNAVFVGWLGPEETFRWSVCSSPQIIVKLGGGEVTASPLLLEISAGSFGIQPVTVHINGVHVGGTTFPGPETPAVTRTIQFDGSLLRPDVLNEIEFHIPQAASPDGGDDRMLGLSLRWLRLSAAE